uniref:Uncharacterized protein n=1 Tax=Plectus sambesii TaxID=2011161 RepID=A0A914VV92_9BILA
MKRCAECGGIWRLDRPALRPLLAKANFRLAPPCRKNRDKNPICRRLRSTDRPTLVDTDSTALALGVGDGVKSAEQSPSFTPHHGRRSIIVADCGVPEIATRKSDNEKEVRRALLRPRIVCAPTN